MTKPVKDWQTYAGISVVALAAAVMSFAAWSELGALVGITQTFCGLRLAWLLPLSVDIYGVTTARVWLHSTTASEDTRRYAQRSSIAAICLSIAGNGAYHFITAVHMITWSWWPLVVVLVSGIPALQLGLALHLAALVGRDTRAAIGVDTNAVAVAVSTGQTAGHMRYGPDSRPVTHPAMTADIDALLNDLHGTSEEDIEQDTDGPRRRTRRPAKRTPKSATEGDNRAAIIKARRDHPEWTQARIAAHVGVVPKTVSRHLGADTATGQDTDTRRLHAVTDQEATS